MTASRPWTEFEADVPVGLVGCDFRRGSSRWRSLLVLSAEERRQLTHELLRSEIVDGFASLDTCNRNEWLFSAKNPCWAAEILKAQMLKRWQGLAGELPQPYVLVADDAVRHVLRVAAGLESFVIGERQILTQLSRSLECARAESTSSVHLNKIGTVAARITRELHDRTTSCGSWRGLHDAACHYVVEHLERPATALVIGMGAIGRRLGEALESVPNLKVLLMNRTVSPGSGNILPLSELHTTRADVILVCTAAPTPVLTPANLPAGCRLLVDLGIPSQIARETAQVPGVARADLDDLVAQQQHGSLTSEQVDISARYMDQGHREFTQFCSQRRFVKILDGTRRKNEEFISKTLPGFLDEVLPAADAGQRNALESQLRALFRNYTASIFHSINDSIIGESGVGDEPAPAGNVATD